MGLRELGPETVDQDLRVTPRSAGLGVPLMAVGPGAGAETPSSMASPSERSSLLHMDWQRKAEDEQAHRRLMMQQEVAVYAAATEDMPPVECEPTYDPNSNKDPIVNALKNYLDKFGRLSSAMPFFAGLLRFLQAQLGETYVCRWRIRWQEIAQVGDVNFTRATVRLLRMYCREHHTIHKDLCRPDSLGKDFSSSRIPAWMVFSLHIDTHDVDVEAMIKRLPADYELSSFEPAGQVDIKTGEQRPSSMVGHQICCCGYFFCIPFPGMYASCIAGRNQSQDANPRRVQRPIMKTGSKGARKFNRMPDHEVDAFYQVEERYT